MLNRKFASIAAGALTLGALSAPGLFTPASAATTAEYAVTYSCVGFGQTVPFEATVDVTTAPAGPVANTVSVQISDFPGIIPVPLNDRVWSVDTTVTDATGAIALTGSLPQSVAASTAAPLPAAAGSAARTVDAAALTFGAAAVTIKKADGTGSPTVMNCTVTEQELVPAGPTIPEGHTAFDCNGPFGAMVYTTELKPTVKRAGANVTVSLKPTDMAGIVPIAAPGTQMDAEMGLTVNGTAVVAKGSHVTDIGPGLPIALPVVTASVPTDATKIDVKVTSFKIIVPGFKMEFPCTLATPADAGSHTVAAKPLPPVVAPKAASSAKVTKVVYSKKTKRAKVSVAVSGKKGTATGKATIVIKKAGKTVTKKVVTLKKGKATWTSKKITKKGTYKVTVKYAGSKTYKASNTSKSKTFKIKK